MIERISKRRSRQRTAEKGREYAFVNIIGWFFIGCIAIITIFRGGGNSESAIVDSLICSLITFAFVGYHLLHGREFAVPWLRIRFPALVMLATAAWVVVQTSDRVPESFAYPIWENAGALLGMAVQGSISVAGEDGWNFLMQLSCIMLVAWISLQLGRNKHWSRRLLWAIVVAGLANTSYGIVDMLQRLHATMAGANIDDAILGGKFDASIAGTFINRSHFATYLSICCVVSGALFADFVFSMDEKRKHDGSNLFDFHRWRGIDFFILFSTVFSCGYLFLGILMTGARLALPSVACGMVAIFFLLMLRNVKLWLPVFLVVVAMCLGVFVFGGQWIVHRFGFFYHGFEIRIAVYNLTIAAIRDNVWLGTGAGTFERFFPIYRDASVDVGGTWNAAHNSYLELAMTLGVPAAAALVLAVALVWWRCLLGSLRRRQDIAFSLAATGAGVVIAIDSLFDFAIQSESVAITLASIFGAGFVQSWSSSANSSPSS